MMATNGSAAQGLFAELDKMRVQIDERLEHLEREKLDIDAQMKRLRAISRAFDGPAPPAKAKARNHYGKSGERSLAQVARAVLDRDMEVFSAIDIQDGTSLTDPTLYACFTTLRERQVIGKAGILPGAKPHVKRQGFRILDREALEELTHAAS